VRYAVSNARPFRTSRPIGGGGDDDACGPPPPSSSSSKRGTRPLNLASRNAIVPRPRIPTTLTERPAAPPPRRYRSLEKSRHVPRSDRSADLTASPTSDAGRAGSYADDNDNGPDADADAVRRGAEPPSSGSRSPSRSCSAVAERRTGDPTVPLPGGRECGGDDDDDHDHADAVGDDEDERRRRRRRRGRRTSTGRDDIDATARIVLPNPLCNLSGGQVLIKRNSKEIWREVSLIPRSLR